MINELKHWSLCIWGRNRQYGRYEALALVEVAVVVLKKKEVFIMVELLYYQILYGMEQVMFKVGVMEMVI